MADATQLLNTPTTHSLSYLRRVTSSLSRGAIGLTWSPLAGLARDNIITYLSQIERGELVISTKEQTWEFGKADSEFPGLKVQLRVKNDKFWSRVALFTDIGLAEAYMLGDVDCDDISTLLKIFIINRSRLGEPSLNILFRPFVSIAKNLAYYGFVGDLANSRANISSHYDIGDIMFRSYLSEDMNYSSAIFRDYEEDLKADESNRETHERAQLRKMKSLLDKAHIKPGDKILEIGTGWGSLAILTAETYPDTIIHTVTLSVHQTTTARQRIQALGLSDRITVYNMDFRESLKMEGWKGTFDKFISVEMMEHVGKNYMEDFWKVADWALKEDTGVGVIQCITLPEARTEAYDKGTDFIQKFIFPGSYIPNITFLLSTLTSASQGRLTLDSIHNIGPHYARTLREWKRKFLTNWEDTIKTALVDKYNLNSTEIEIFKRKWIYYFDYCESGFATRRLGDHAMTFTREGNISYGCGYKIED